MAIVNICNLQGLSLRMQDFFKLTLFVISVSVVALLGRRRLTMGVGMNNALQRLTHSLIVQMPAFSS